MDLCPGCGQKPPPDGIFLSRTIRLPAEMKLMLVRVRLAITVLVQYCPKCSCMKLELLRIELN